MPGLLLFKISEAFVSEVMIWYWAWGLSAVRDLGVLLWRCWEHRKRHAPRVAGCLVLSVPDVHIMKPRWPAGDISRGLHVWQPPNIHSYHAPQTIYCKYTHRSMVKN